MASGPNLPEQTQQQMLEHFSSTPQAPTMFFAHGEIVMAYFSEPEIEALAGAGNSAIYLTFFGICVGVFFTLVAVFIGSDVSDPRKLAIGSSLMFVSLIGSAVFGLLGRSEYKKANTKKDEFKQRFQTAKTAGNS